MVASASGLSLVEVVLALGLIAIAGGVSIAPMERAWRDIQERGAARAFAARVRQARAEALQRSAAVGFHFERAADEAAREGTGDATSFRLYLDGNGNGLRAREIASAIDRPLAPATTLAEAVGPLTFAIDAGTPLVDADDEIGGGGGGSGASGGSGGGEGSEGGGGGGGTADRDPLRLGGSDFLTFGPTGRGSSGTLYLRGAHLQFAVRVYGPTGRVRLLEYRPEVSGWGEL